MFKRSTLSAIAAIVVTAATAAYSLIPGVTRRDESCPAHFLGGVAPSVDGSRDKNASTLCYSSFSVRFSGVTKTPIWSAEKITGDQAKQAIGLPRTGMFHEERKLPRTMRSELSDYKFSGYDRGHLTPSGDMASQDTQNETFTLANMIPQHPCSNQGIWAGLESSVRKIAISQGEIYVVTGTVYSGREKSIGRGGVAVPDSVFKAIYDPVTGQAGAYLAENSEASPWQTMTIATLRETAGVDPFPALPEEVKQAGMPLPKPEKSKFRCKISDQRKKLN
jgi:endonuclease G